MSLSILYDESFDALVRTVRETLGDHVLEKGLVLREAAGRLTFVFDGELDSAHKEQLSVALRERLGSYARPDRVVACRSDPGATGLLAEEPRQWLASGDQKVRYVDRRLVGIDWIGGPSGFLASPARLVFGSLKGGVGRSTALCIAAADLARQGKNVLVVDLDLEAPGVGALLLPDDDGVLPPLGVVDYLAERCVDNPTGLVPQLVASSPLMTQHTGRVDVVPVAGSATRPEHYMGKLSRAMLDIAADGSTLPVRVKVGEMINQLAERSSYDVILIDARAGLAEITAAPFLGLGATLLLFGTAQRQTIMDYRLLFAHLATLVAPGKGSPWQHLKMVQAKTTPDMARNRWFVEELSTLFQDYLYEESEGLEGFNFDIEDAEAPHYPVPIALNPLFADWDPTRRLEHLSFSFYDASFRLFLDQIDRLTK